MSFVPSQRLRIMEMETETETETKISPKVTSEGTNIPLPSHVFEEILLTLDLKTLFPGCALVCRDWNSLITSHRFVSLYSNRYFPPRNEVLLAKTYDDYNLHSDNDDFKLLRRVGSPPIDGFQGYIVVGTSNGLVCLIDSNPLNKLTLWNPKIRKYVLVPIPLIGGEKSSLGFGFDGTKEEFKVVILVRCQNVLDRAWVFSYATWSWKPLPSPLPCYVHDDVSHVFINGKFHWIACEVGKYSQFILTYDLANEVFGKISFPESVPAFGTKNIVRAGDLLALSIDWSTSGLSGLSVWVMEEYGVKESWKKVVEVVEDFLREARIPSLLAIRKNMEMIIEMKGGGIVRYNSTTSTRKFLGLRLHGAFIGNYDESLHLLEKIFILKESLRSY